MIHAIWTLDANAALQSLIAISVLLGIVLLARKTVARTFGASAAYLLWLLPLARFALPPLPANLSLFAFAPSPASTATSAETPVAAAAHANMAPPKLEVGMTPPELSLPMEPHAAGSLTSSGLAETAMSGALTYLLPALVAIWLIGALVCLLRSTAAHHTFLKVVKAEAEPVSSDVERLAAQIAREIGMKKSPRIASSLISNGPLVTGLTRPIILLPAWFESDYDLSEQRAALAHEMMHVRRKDIWALQISEIVSAVFWFNPLIWMARPAFRVDQEAACDADVLRADVISPHAYGSTLLKAVRIALPERLPAGASLALTHAIKERLYRMTRPAPTKKRRVLGLGLTALLGSAALMATASVTATADEHKRLTLSEGTLYVDGQKIEDRQFVLLGDPFKDITLEPEVELEIERLSNLIGEEAANLASIEIARLDFTVPPMPPIPGFASNPPVPPAVPAMGVGEDPDAYEARIDAWEDKFEAEMESWEEKIEAEAEAWAEKHTEEIASKHAAKAHAHANRQHKKHAAHSHKMETHSHRIEKHAAKLEAMVEREFGGDFEARVEDASNTIDTLVDACIDADLSRDEVRVVEHISADGETYRAACVHGDRATLTSTSTAKAISRSEKLCDREKDMFSELSGGQNLSITTE